MTIKEKQSVLQFRAFLLNPHKSANSLVIDQQFLHLFSLVLRKFVRTFPIFDNAGNNNDRSWVTADLIESLAKMFGLNVHLQFFDEMAGVFKDITIEKNVKDPDFIVQHLNNHFTPFVKRISESKSA